EILIEMAGHLALSGNPANNGIAWGVGDGASQINGGPYHFKLNGSLDGISLGSQDNQIKGADILVPPVTPTVTTAIHLGVTDSGAPTVVTTAQPLGTAVHDSVLVTGNNGPVTGKATFDFYKDLGTIGVKDAADVLLGTSNALTLTNGAVDAQGLFTAG